MGVKRSKRRSSVRDPLYRLWRFFEEHHGVWWAANAGFERRDAVTVDGTRWTIIYKIHVVRSEGARADKLDFKSSITVWPATTAVRRRPARVPDESDAGRLSKEWRQKCQREIRQHGYRGGWEKSPAGQFGDFWKTLKDASSVATEVKLLDQMRL
jgi:hypothetical protein